ncbi:hypothetical protein Vretimale_8128 [Volvox reticuliferus]|nr:hypothetical protein Vretifemale_5273 [Volvox reticuliferus]GIM03378.1 hypothetical protein Vretimale_8128 [Volvox reticuliferus]
MAQGPHLLAPTASDLDCNGRLGAGLAGYHYDLNLITVHGRSRFPGLYVWLRDGRRVAVRIPPGCLLMQAGKQLEWLTGGYIMAGMHEVVVTETTLAAVEAARAAGRSTWRISSTVFTHCASDAVLRPLGRFTEQPGSAEAYPAIKAGDQVQRELEAICLRKMAVASSAAAGAGPGACPSPVANKTELGSASTAALGGSVNNPPVGGVNGGPNNGSSCATGVAISLVP